MQMSIISKKLIINKIHYIKSNYISKFIKKNLKNTIKQTNFKKLSTNKKTLIKSYINMSRIMITRIKTKTYIKKLTNMTMKLIMIWDMKVSQVKTTISLKIEMKI